MILIKVWFDIELCDCLRNQSWNDTGVKTTQRGGNKWLRHLMSCWESMNAFLQTRFITFTVYQLDTRKMNWRVSFWKEKNSDSQKLLKIIVSEIATAIQIHDMQSIRKERAEFMVRAFVETAAITLCEENLELLINKYVEKYLNGEKFTFLDIQKEILKRFWFSFTEFF